MDATDYANSISQLSPVPTVALRIKKLIDQDMRNVGVIANIVNTDPGLAAHILKIANSAIYRFPRKIDNVKKAIQVIGTSAVYDFALIFGVSKAFLHQEHSLVDLDKFWEQSVTCAILSKYFATSFGCNDADRIFSAGLLHNIGELAVLQVNTEVAVQCTKFNELTKPKERQLDTLKYTYADISVSLCKNWSLPDSLVNIIASQHHAGSFADKIEEQVIQLSYELSLINTYPNYYSLSTDLPAFLYEGLHLEISDADEALDVANYQVEKILHLFNPFSFKAA